MFLPTLSNNPIGRYHSAAPAKPEKDQPKRSNQPWLVVIKNNQNTQLRIHYGKYVFAQSK